MGDGILLQNGVLSLDENGSLFHEDSLLSSSVISFAHSGHLLVYVTSAMRLFLVDLKERRKDEEVEGEREEKEERGESSYRSLRREWFSCSGHQSSLYNPPDA